MIKLPMKCSSILFNASHICISSLHVYQFLIHTVYPLAHSQKAKPQDTLDLCGILNDDLAATVRRYPKRFVGLGTLPMQAPELAVREMRRCVLELGFPGVQIGSHINTWDLNAPELHPVYAVSRVTLATKYFSVLFHFNLRLRFSFGPLFGDPV